MISQKLSKDLGFKVKPNILHLYTDAGLTLVPCAGYGKAFERAGLMTTLFNPSLKIRDCNYKVLLRNQYLIIDVDPRNFSDPNDKPLSRLCTDLGLDVKKVRDTFTVRTPSGGLHFYFKKHEKINCRASLKDYAGLEFLSSTITAAGSYNPDKDKNYEIIHKSPVEISPCPDEILVILTREESVDVVAAGLMNNHPANLAKFVDYIANCTPAKEGQNGDRRTFQVAAMGKDLLIDVQTCYKLMLEYFNPRCQPPWSEDDLLEKIKHAYEYGYKPAGVNSIENDFKEVPHEASEKITIQIGDNKKPILNIANTITMLTRYSDSIFRDNLRLNLLSHRIEFIKDPPWHTNGKEWTDDDAIQTKTYLSVNKHWDVQNQMIHDAVVVIASRACYHPVRRYLESLVWDNVPRLNSWLHDVCATKLNDYTMYVARKTLIGGVARVMNPGCKFDHALVLVGDQGTGKSLVCRILGEPWFTDASLDIRHKDSVEILQGNWIIELSEMDVLTKTESRALKGFITRQTDIIRPAYARAAKPFPRQCIFIGTINPEAEGFLKDPTGNRRWWPVDVGRINIPLLRSIKDQLWAEAYVMFKKGEQCHVESSKIAMMTARETEKYQQEDPWFSVIRDWLDNHEYQFYDDKKFEFRIQLHEIYGQCLGGNVVMLKAAEAVRIATILKRLGFHKGQGSVLSSVYSRHLNDSI